MPTTPQPIRVRPLRLSDLPSKDALPFPILMKVVHAGQQFFTTGTVTNVEKRADSRLSGGRGAGHMVSVSARTDTGREWSVSMLTDPADLALFSPHEQERMSELRFALPTDESDPDGVEVLSDPQWGAEVNVRVLIRDGDPASIAEAVKAAVEDALTGARVVRAQARPVADLRVNIIEDVYPASVDEPIKTVRALGVLSSEVLEYLRDASLGTISSVDVPYGTANQVVISQD